jgi:hypothetical protein
MASRELTPELASYLLDRLGPPQKSKLRAPEYEYERTAPSPPLSGGRVQVTFYCDPRMARAIARFGRERDLNRSQSIRALLERAIGDV